ncbi:hypothetical protein PC116_g20536 [Phytophthora cactorum]|uniref:Uncharacterized protein n=1 Tax=Phytophthora cactorum TaxID=29920 RepID=A0A8T1CDT1_9STRA|nr:hypothetical protein PC114_g18033 [Phytophthora cactorum]KAG2919233.1 hypothetical protein PC117_g16866 [Phytophthora cactorum]KAG3003524.1 hypothetical protein PC119_g15950 [Phytophthora cactorum]KAG3007460.1 hypothetical protein PC120_g16825 [Phytophthora cactorum]KAG3176394.1 hypothetical protein C6341_g8979 [Phytophthora cactorum]
MASEGRGSPSVSPRLGVPCASPHRETQALLFTNTLGFADHVMNLEEDVAEVLTATLILHFPDLLVLSPDSAIVARVRDAM